MLHEAFAKRVEVCGAHADRTVGPDGDPTVLELGLHGPVARALQKERHVPQVALLLDLDLALHVVDRVAGCPRWSPSCLI